jgi:photosystem II stability/assembly factor-like uncharacterized protein
MSTQHYLLVLLVPAALLLPSAAPAATADSFEATLKGPGGRCLGVDGAPRERAPVVLEACTGAADQAWRLPADGFAGELRQGGFCLDVDRAEATDGTPLQLFGCHGGANQRWTRTAHGAWAGLAGKCLSIEGASAVLDTCDGADRQHFLVGARNRWSWLDTPGRQPVERAVLTADPEIVYGARVHGYTHQPLLRSADGGRTFGPATEALFVTAPLLVDARDPNHLFATSQDNDSLLRSADGGRTWRVVIDQRILLVRASRNEPDRFFATDGSSLWRSIDRGVHFLPIAGPAAEEAPIPFYPLDLAEAADGSFYLATPDYSGPGQATQFFRLAGGVWQQLPVRFDWQPHQPEERHIVVHPTAPGLIYLLLPGIDTAATRLYRSEGGDWLPLTVPEGRIDRAYVVPGQPDVLWLTIDGALWRSADRGQTWQDVSPLPGSLAIVEGFPTSTGLRLLARVEEPERYFESADGGATWLESAPLGMQRKGPHRLVASRVAGRFYALEYDAIRRTDDGGRTWRTLDPLNVDFLRKLVEDPLDPDILYVSTSTYHFSAIHRSRDGGATFPDHLSGNSLELALVGPAGGRVLLMISSGSVYRSTDDGATWTAISIPEQVSGLIDDRGVIYGSAFDRGVRSRDAGLTWEVLPQNGAPLVAGGGLVGVLRHIDSGALADLGVSSDQGTTWRYLPLPLAHPYSGTLRVDNTGVLYFQDYGGILFRSQSAGATWEAIGDGLGQSAISDLAADPSQPGRLLAATPGGIFATQLGDDRPLSLQSGRFEIALRHRDAAGVERAGHALSLTADSGQFWLFTPERAEVAVKLLDARAIDGRFWVFVASLSNVEFDLEVLDRASGERRRYHNPQGVMASFADTAAFPQGAPEPAAAALPSYRSILRDAAVTTLHDRFEVSVMWRTATGQSGEGQGGELGAESAAFSFFSRENVELIVNVIDGRPLNGKYWVFYAGLTNVGYTITLRDRVTGAIKTYDNPLGSFASVADTAAF